MTAVLIEWVNLDLRHRHWRRPCEREDGCLPAEERGLNRSPLKLSGGTSPADTLISSFQTPEWRDDKYLLLKPPHRGCSVTAARVNEYLPRAIAESWGHISSHGYLGIRLLQADCHLPMQRNYGQSKQVGGAHIKLPGAVLEGQQAPEDVRSRPRSTQPQIPPSGPARTTLGAPNPFSCPLGEAGPLSGLGLSPTPESALLTLHPRTLLRGSHGDALQPSPSDTGNAGPLGTQQPACLRGSAVWKEGDRAGDRPGPTGLGKVAGAREKGSQCPLAPDGPKRERRPHPAPASWGRAPCCQISHFLPKSQEDADFCQNSLVLAADARPGWHGALGSSVWAPAGCTSLQAAASPGW